MKKQLLFLATLCVFMVSVVFASPPGHDETQQNSPVINMQVAYPLDAAIGMEVCPAFRQQTSVFNSDERFISMKSATTFASGGTTFQRTASNHDINTTRTYAHGQRILNVKNLYKRDAYQRHIQFADDANSSTGIPRSMVYIC
jgi:hypothetical protein